MDLTLILASIIGGGGAIFSGFKAFSSIPEGYKGVKTTWGKASRNEDTGEIIVWEPGGKWIWPWRQEVESLRMEGNFVEHRDLSITLKNNLTYKFHAFVTYDVKDDPASIEHILFKMENRDLFVENQFMKIIHKVLHKSEELDVKNQSNRLRREMSVIMEENGWIVTDCDIMLFTETPVSQFLRGVDYRIQKAIEYKDQLPQALLCSALGVNSVVTVDDGEFDWKDTEQE